MPLTLKAVIAEIKPSGSGTISDPFIIANAGNLKYLQNRTGKTNDPVWKAGAYFQQTDNIDLGNDPSFGMIGSSTSAFKGHYDGGGYTISNYTYHWDNVDSGYSYGLFCYIMDGASICNLVIDNATLSRTSISKTNKDDVKIGVLVGSMAPKQQQASAENATRVENIIIRRSRITDMEGVKLVSYFVGGVVGNVANIISGSDILWDDTYSGIVIRNIYAEVDIDMSHTERSNTTDAKYTQSNVGGILGRIRKGRKSDLPVNTLYRGTIKAPKATVSPTWGSSRATTDANRVIDPTVRLFAGEYVTQNASNKYAVLQDDADNNNRYFADFYVMHSSDDITCTVDKITDTTPSGTGCKYGTRTFGTHEKTGTYDITKASDMAMFQGVNHATYLESIADSRVLEMFNDYAVSNPGMKSWGFSDGKYFLYNQILMEGSQTSDFSFKVQIEGLDNKSYEVVWFYPDGTEAYRTEGVSDANPVSEFINDRYTRYYTVVLYDSNGLPLQSVTVEPRQYELSISTSDYTSFQLNNNFFDQNKFTLRWAGIASSDGSELQLYDGIGATMITNPDAILAREVYVNVYDSYGTFVAKSPSLISSRRLEVDLKTRGGEIYYTAKLMDGNTVAIGPNSAGKYIGVEGFAWLWEVSSDPSALDSWESTNLHSWKENEKDKGWEDDDNINGMQSYAIHPYRTDRYYRISLCQLLTDASGAYLMDTDRDGNSVYRYRVVMSEVVGPKNIVFVYDMAKNQVGNQFYVVDQFSGLDPTGTPYPDGSDINTGYDPYHAVKTVHRAYEVLKSKSKFANPGKMADNIVVIMGFYYPDKAKEGYCVWQKGKESSYATSATVTGKFNAIDYHGTLNLASPSNDPTSLGASTTFSDIVISGYDSYTSDADMAAFARPKFKLFLYSNRHDITFGQNVKMLGFNTMDSGYGTIDGKNVPEITVVAGIHNYNISYDKSQIPNPTDVAVPGMVTINIYSGSFGRIISSSRNAAYNKVTHNVFGQPENPHRVKVNINIEHNSPMEGEFVPADYYYNTGGISYHYDIGMVTGGQTDGSIYGEIEINFVNGYIGRYISGNISYGRNINDEGQNFPADGFYGSTTLNMTGGEIYELYGGSLGRFEVVSDPKNNTEMCEAYFYGRSVINIFGGTIRSNIYGSGAGGVSGFGDATFHTDDTKVPYYTSDNQLAYGGYEEILAAGGLDRIATVKMKDDSDLSLVRTTSEVNLYGGIVEGNVFGGGYGYSFNIPYDKVSSLAGNLYGDSSVKLLPNPEAGKADAVIKGNVYGGGEGSSLYYNLSQKAGMSEEEASNLFGGLACVYGNSTVEILSGHVYGDVYGAGMGVEGFSDMATVTGNATVTVDGARVAVDGNIFGGSNLSALHHHPDHQDPQDSGNTKVEIRRGTIGNNIFGGSAGSMTQTAYIEGSTELQITGGTYIADPYIHTDDGDVARTFNIYGGGYLNSIVEGNTFVNVEKSLLTKEGSIEGGDFSKVINDVTFRRFCLYGGGFGEKTCVNGNASVRINIKPDAGVTAPKGDALTELVPGQTFFDVAGGGYSGNVGYWATEDGTPVSEVTNPTVSDFDHFVDGHVSVEIQGYPFIRKVIGGAFYASVGDTDTRLISGNIQSIYGGGLMGYVHRKANLTIGSNSTDSSTAANDNGYLYVLEDVFGGNDVEGVIGTKLWTDDFYKNPDGSPIYSQEVDGAPLFTTDIDVNSDKGVDLRIYGGTIKGNVYGAGNGHYRGYYVPGWLRYADGPRRQYRQVFLNTSSRSEDNMGDVYKSRPMVGIVKMHIGGNSATDRVKIGGSVFGGGRSCGIGKWNSILPFEDPRRLAQGGSLQMNFGSHVTVKGNLYLGIQGEEYTSQSGVPAGINLANFDGTSTAQLDLLGETAYDHWYLDRTLGYYVPGFPTPGDTDYNLGLSGQHLFRGYMKNIEMNADVELTFYNDPYDGAVRKSWLPIEQAKTMYDADDVVITNFFTGGQCGSMTNNHLMKTADEEYGGIYRVSLTDGLKIYDKVVGGSENAITHIYPYNSDFTEVLYDEEPLYRFEGGMVTQSGIGYDLIIYNDIHKDDNNTIGRDPSEYLNADNADIVTLSDGTEIHRYNYEASNPCIPHNVDLSTKRYSLAVTKEAGGKIFGYIGAREKRPTTDQTVLKMAVDCTFIPQGSDDDHQNHFGGIIYGGCYNSGLMVGDIILHISANMLGEHVSSEDPSTFGEISSLRHNLGRVFGGGYGKDSRVDGDIHINLLHNFKAMNVFGGGCRGNVNGTTTINYVGSETGSFIYGTLYGGGLSGYVGIEKNEDGTNNWSKRATTVNLYSGNVDKVYGGSCMGHLYGQAKVYACDELVSHIPFLDENTLYPDGINMAGSRLVAGWIYGGNDITGEIHTQYDADNADDAEYMYSAIVNTNEIPSDSTPSEGSDGPGKTSPGHVEGYNGFPLIGNLYGGANGNYGVHGDGTYASGEVALASGIDAGVVTIDLTGEKLPVLSDVLLHIQGGTIINAFGGGNMVTVTGSTTIRVDYSDETETNIAEATTENKTRARAGFATADELARAWRVMHITSKAQKQEVCSSKSGGYVFTDNINRLYGGNDNADMDIQPTWELNRAYLGSIYSGGNFGRMTYYHEDATTGQQTGLYLGITSRNLRATNVYGGGRVGDIAPAIPEGTTLNDDFYGATLVITDGVVAHVYGGNDVSGRVHQGAKVNIHGAISGDVYCAGNGNHLFQYDQTGTVKKIEEWYDDDLGGRYFKLPAKAEYTNSAADIIRAINSYRPNIDRAYMHISGRDADSRAYVRGNVYCGGNSATVIQGDRKPDIRFDIGSHVVLNGVYLGSNGENLTNGEMMRLTEILNRIDLKDNGTSELLDLYMEAVAVDALPKDFELKSDLEDAYIGNFFVGGNRGSMLTKEKISLTFPECLTVYGRIVGGSNNANLTYKDITHIGGLTGETDDEKVHLTIKNRFEPWRLAYSTEIDDRVATLEADVDVISGKIYYPGGKCSVYGGCYTSGVTIGAIGIDVYSDMMAEYDQSSAIASALAAKGVDPGLLKKRMVADGLNDLTRKAFAVVGGGYGANTEVRGNVHVRMLPAEHAASAKTHNAPAVGTEITHPSVGLLYGGSELGNIVGNTLVEVRDGLVFTNLYGASESAPMYGSTQTIIGYPQYYICNTTGRYELRRTDTLSRGAEGGDLATDDDGQPTIKKEIYLRQGDILSISLHDAIINPAEGDFSLIDDEQPANWDDIDISIGYGGLVDHESEYYGFGNVYGGGFVSASSSVSLAGKYTVCRFTDEYTPDAESVGYGGNSMILVWDNKDNATADESAIRDHISIGTGHYVPVSLKAGQNANGKYQLIDGKYMSQGAEIVESAVAASEKKYFQVESDGGVYGGGRKVFVEGFRDCHIAYYGYADFTPQFPKLINTFQRFDLLTVEDCCLQLHGATDFATGKLDATKYSLTRIGELSMVSSLPSDEAFYPGVAAAIPFRNLTHDKKRVRNYMAFLNDVHYLAAVTSNQTFDDPLHGADGQINTFGDYDGATSALNTPQTDKDYTYKSYKTKRINEYYAEEEPSIDAKIGFDQRNLATAKNMFGISNGYVLNIQSGVQKGGIDQIYYGPVTGVFEVKLMTLSPNEGGGYVYALNRHQDPDHFLETTGNFVFPGAAHTKTAARSEETVTYNYVFDDCFPMDLGWDYYNPKGDCNEQQEIHYWYVDGDEFFYNVTLTAYTSTATDNKFTLNNNEQIIYLRGVKQSENPTLKVDRVIWAESDNDSSDLQNVSLSAENGGYNKDYRFFISVDGNPQGVHTTDDKTQLSFVAPIPRADYISTAASDCDDALVTQADAVSNFKDMIGDEKNLPLAGITLLDKVDNSTRVYYDEHLQEPEYVTIVMTNDADNRHYKYTINLTIKYLLGPTINGLPEIENCALPGEYIFANSFGVTVDLDDETMAVNSRNWYAVSDEIDLSATNSDIASVIAGIKAGTAKGINLESQKFDDDRQVHIPAYLYLDGWHLVYEIVANGQPFYLRADTKDYDHGFTHGLDQLTVHNYHRMRPWDGTSYDAYGEPACEDLKIIAGARIYIEDDDDMAYFYKWLTTCQAEPSTFTEDGRPINPQYGAGTMIMLMNDVKLPASLTAAGLRFDGVFHGNGHNITLNGNKMMLGTNAGEFYNTGFVAANGTDLTVFGDNAGLIENCFLYTLNNKGLMDGNDRQTNIINSYRTSELDEAQQLGGLMRASLAEFEYGQIAYNLNLFYLHGRYDRGHGYDDIDDEVLSPLRDIYYNGDFRFALWSEDDNPDALRTHPIPNYRNYQGKRTGVNIDNYGPVTGRDATNHNMHEELSVESEHAVTDQESGDILYYRPIFPKDYLFFGQDLRYGSTEEEYPHTITSANRVYRASGYYGSMVDRGFHFNDEAQAVQPTLTAVDFTGFRDAEHSNTYVDERVVRTNAAGDINQICFYTPMLDMPADGVKSFTTSTKKMGGCDDLDAHVTRNLLIYVEEGDEAFEAFDYTRDDVESDIYGHLIYPAYDAETSAVKTDVNPSTALLHLVDYEDFNCPIATTVTEYTWYERSPELFSSGNNAWDGLCIPFTVQKVEGVISDPLANPIRSHGELSHFYGPHVGVDKEEPSHEYWLRKFTSVGAGKLMFDRPASEDDVQFNAGLTEETHDYHFSNTYNSVAFGKVYGDGTTHARPQYTPEGMDYKDYPMITREMPYIISFPGRRFYEFDLSGTFYAEKFPGTSVIPQRIVFSTTGENVIAVSDYSAIKTMSHDGIDLTGTYMHKKVTAADRYIAAISGDKADHFEQQGAESVIRPFRVYVSTTAAQSKPLYIGSREIDTIGDGSGEDDDTEDLRFSIDHTVLVIESAQEEMITLPLYDIDGRLIRYLDIHEGENRYTGIAPGYYVVDTFKFVI